MVPVALHMLRDGGGTSPRLDSRQQRVFHGGCDAHGRSDAWVCLGNEASGDASAAVPAPAEASADVSVDAPAELRERESMWAYARQIRDLGAVVRAARRTSRAANAG